MSYVLPTTAEGTREGQVVAFVKGLNQEVLGLGEDLHRLLSRVECVMRPAEPRENKMLPAVECMPMAPLTSELSEVANAVVAMRKLLQDAVDRLEV